MEPVKKLYKKRIGKLLARGAVVTMLLLTGCGTQAEREQEAELEMKQELEPELEQTVEPIVKVIAGNSSGSGVIYERTDSALIIVTAGHVLEMGDGAVEIVFEDGCSVSAESYIISQTSEVAFVNISLADIPEKNTKAYQPVQVDKTAFDELAEGAFLTLRGAAYEGIEWTKNGTLLYPWIYVEDFGQYMMLVQGECEPGMSGGALFDIEYNYCGILCGVNDKNETAVVPLSVIMTEYMQAYQ